MSDIIYCTQADMTEAQFVRVTHAGQEYFVALYAGLNPQELCRYGLMFVSTEESNHFTYLLSVVSLVACDNPK